MKKLIAVLAAITAAAVVASEFAYVQVLDAQTRTMDAGAKLLLLKTESDARMLMLRVQIARAMGIDPSTGKPEGAPKVEKPALNAPDGTPLRTL